MELGKWIRLLLRWSWLFVLASLAAVVVTYQLTSASPPVYEATARALVGPALNGEQVNVDTLRASSMLANTYRDYAATRRVLDSAITELALPMTASELASHVATTANPDNRMIEVRVRDASSERAVAIAAKLVEVMARVAGVADPSPAARVTPYDLPTSGRKVKSPLEQMMPLAVLAALVLSALVMLTVEQGTRLFGLKAVASAEELAATGILCLGVLPVARGGRPDSPERLFLNAGSPRPATDRYRLAAARLLAAVRERGAKSLLVCSVTGEGSEADVAANLAIALAERVGRVVLVDAALEQPRLGSLFGGSEAPKLMDLLIGKPTASLPSLRWLPSLTVVPAGAAASNSSRLLNSAEMATLVRTLSERADLVILRACSVLNATDALLLGGEVDAVLLVARRGATSERALHQAGRELELIGARVIGGVLVEPVRLGEVAAPRESKSLPSLSAADRSAMTGGPSA